MKEVTMNAAELKAILQTNREKHRSQYEDAIAGYIKECVTVLEEYLVDLKDGKIRRVMVQEVMPEDHTSDYDRVLSMIDHSVHDEVTLTEDEYENYVLDNWGWKDRWMHSNTKYLSK